MIYYDFFHSFIWKTKLNYEGKDKLIKKIEDNYAKRPNLTPKKWKCSVHSSMEFQTSSDFNIPEDLLDLLQSKITNFLDDYQKKIKLSGEYILKECWYNAYKGNQFQEIHDHGESLFSGCYYLKFNKNKHYPTEFYNPNYKINFSKVENNSYFSFTPDCEENDLIIFPSQLMHGTKGVKNKCEELRITISFNISNKSVRKNTNSFSNKIIY